MNNSLGESERELVNCRCVLEFDDGTRLTNGNESGIMRVGSDTIGTGSGRVNTPNAEISGNNSPTRLSSIFVNSNDSFYQNAKKIKPLDGYSDIIMHGSPTKLLAFDNNNAELSYNAKEAAELIRNSREFCGKPIRLISCNTGQGNNCIAQQISDILGVDVLAPTEAVYVNCFGEMLITDNDSLSILWDMGVDVKDTGKWILFSPRKE